eukprot:TRINITY_DN10272_c0_g1_i1.p1 TRINITY_DN10272_c0_g1~~TRINITY_DN10272_c0_g1_i1.p1  ORF type:complete len:211 (+),score=59.31 TRINITY_DN10272_c0_g1_i1:138-770(+)
MSIQYVDNASRRKIDTTAFEERAKQREQEQSDEKRGVKRPAIQVGKFMMRAPLQAREEEVELGANLGKTQIVADKDKGAGYHCKLCDCWLKDSNTYLDHINGKKHQRAQGMSMRAERSTVDDVRARLQIKKAESTGQLDYEARMTLLQAQEEKEKQEKKEKKKEKKKLRKEAESKAAAESKPTTTEPTEDQDVFASMGLPMGFSSTKKST